MSRTDKDRPEWVIRHVENFAINHDHRSGKCIEETLEYARNYNSGMYRSGYRHNCLKRLEHEYYCTEDSPFRTYTYRWSKGRFWKPSGENSCWGEWEVATQYVGPRYPGVHHNGFLYRTKKNGCLGPHKRWETVETIPCVCNGWPVTPTCEPSWYGEDLGHRYWSAYGARGISMSERCRVGWHGPERRREREAANGWIKEARAGGDLDDWDYDNRQAGNSVLWDVC